MSKTIHDVASELLAALDAYRFDLAIAKRYTVELCVDGQRYHLSFTANSLEDAVRLCQSLSGSLTYYMVSEVAP